MTCKPDQPREALATRIATLTEVPAATAYADFIRQGDGGPIPCWGAIEARFAQEFKRDEDRLALWNVLVEAEDRRALLLFIEQSVAHPEVLAKIAADAHRLPPATQRALVGIDEAVGFLRKTAQQLDPAARQLLEDEDARCRERTLMQSRVAQLRAFQYFIPDTIDPQFEGKGHSAVVGSDDTAPIVDSPSKNTDETNQPTETAATETIATVEPGTPTATSPEGLLGEALGVDRGITADTPSVIKTVLARSEANEPSQPAPPAKKTGDES